jgi:serine/threonine-protein kinase RsbW
MNDKCTWKLELEIPSDSIIGCEVIRQVLDKLQADNWSEDDQFAVHMALEEGIMNAINHGNKRDKTKKVHIEFRLSPKYCYLKVCDEGDGFVLAEVPDPTLDENLEKGSGRGIMLIQEFMDSLKYIGCGNQVEMTKSRTSE